MIRKTPQSLYTGRKEQKTAKHSEMVLKSDVCATYFFSTCRYYMEAPSSPPIASPTEPVSGKCSGEQAQENYATQFATGPVFRGAEIHKKKFTKGPSEVVDFNFF